MRGHRLHRALLLLPNVLLGCLRMFEVKQLVLDSGSQVLVPILGRVDALVLRVEVALLVDSDGTFVEVRLSVCPTEFIVNCYAQLWAFFLALLRFFLNAISMSSFEALRFFPEDFFLIWKDSQGFEEPAFGATVYDVLPVEGLGFRTPFAAFMDCMSPMLC